MDLLGLGSKVEVDFILDRKGERQKVNVRNADDKNAWQYIYYDGEDVTGTVEINLKKNSKVEHQGIRLEFIGQIEMMNERSGTQEFINLPKVLSFPGELSETVSFEFSFAKVEKPYETYTGINVKLRYFLRLTIIKRFRNDVFERDICVQHLSQYPETNNSIKMEVGIEDCLHIEFEYNKSKYHLKDVIIGKIYFLLVRIKVKYMEISILKKESTNTGSNVYTDSDTIEKYEIMDGAPVRGESIPIRLFLAAYGLTPTMRDVQRKFSVRYFLNLVLIDEEERRYFKQQEIILWRKNEKDNDKIQQTTNQYAHFESTNVNGNSSGDREISSENNSDTPSD